MPVGGFPLSERAEIAFKKGLLEKPHIQDTHNTKGNKASVEKKHYCMYSRLSRRS